MIISDLALNTSIFITSIVIVAVSSYTTTDKKEKPDVPLKSEEIKIKPKEEIDLYTIKLKCNKLEKSSEELLNDIKKDLK